MKIFEPRIEKENFHLSFSLLSRYYREGFSPSLFEPVKETDALRFGKLVDDYAFDTAGNKYMVEDSAAKLTETERKVFEALDSIEVNDEFMNDDNLLLDFMNSANLWSRMRPETRLGKIKDLFNKYKVKLENKDKVIVSKDEMDDVLEIVKALKESAHTAQYFNPNNAQFQVHLYDDLFFTPCKGFIDIVYIDDENKQIRLLDLKTTSDVEKFKDSFYKYQYFYQAKIYTELFIRMIEEEYPEYATYKLLPFAFVCVDRKSKMPVIYEYREAYDLDEEVCDPYRVYPRLSELVSDFKKHMELETVYWKLDFYNEFRKSNGTFQI